MSRSTRTEETVEFILSELAAGRFDVGGRLPSEAVLAELAGTSRLTVREAIQTLAAQRVLSPVQGRGTFVNPVDQWISVEALMRMQNANPREVLLQLVEVRGFIEIGASEHLAEVVTDQQIAQLRRQLDDMIAGDADGDIARVMAADLAFHQTITDGCGNPFIAATLQPLSRVLAEARLETSRVPVMRAHAIVAHGRVLTAIEARDRAAARKAMRAHMRETADDIRDHFVDQKAAARRT